MADLLLSKKPLAVPGVPLAPGREYYNEKGKLLLCQAFLREKKCEDKDKVKCDYIHDENWVQYLPDSSLEMPVSYIVETHPNR